LAHGGVFAVYAVDAVTHARTTLRAQ
jgi:hypothetical protein